MIRLSIALLIFFQVISPRSQPALTQAAPPEIHSAMLCLPGIYMIDPQDCLPAGPSSYLTSMASLGISMPLVTIPYQPIDETHWELPFSYAALGDGPTAVYASLEEAIVGKNPIRSIDPGGLRYVSYIDYADTDNGRFFKLHDQSWVRVSSRVSIPHSYPGGIQLDRTPTHSFGWVLPFNPTMETKRKPGFNPDNNTGHILSQYQIVPIYSTQVVDGVEWDLVAPDEWVESRLLGRVTPNLTPPEGVTSDRWIEVNLAEQTLTVYDQNRMIFSTLIATGLDPFFTRPGSFQIQRKLDSTPMSGSFEADRSDYYYLEDVPWTMYYDNARALHAAYWRTAYGFPQSHGCVNLNPADAHWLYEWANEGDWVYVWDPSGKTPTDPKFYGEGGA